MLNLMLSYCLSMGLIKEVLQSSDGLKSVIFTLGEWYSCRALSAVAKQWSMTLGFKYNINHLFMIISCPCVSFFTKYN